MKIYKDDYLKEGATIKDIVKSLFDDRGLPFFQKKPSFYGKWEPLSDIYQKDENYIISIDLPGVVKDDIKLMVENNALTISGERRRPDEFSEDSCFRSERYFGSFEKIYSIPDNIDKEKVEAEFSDGVLSVILPKLPEAQKKTIKINIEKK